MAQRVKGEQRVHITKNYRLFERSADNRPTDLKMHKKLQQSMERYGFLACFPIVCYRDASKKLIVKDGQHRLAIAEKLGLPVHWLEEAVDFDVAWINGTPRGWRIKDYADKYAKQGKRAYAEGLEFAEVHQLPLGTAFAMLGGTTTFGNVKDTFTDGNFTVKDRKWADAVAEIYGPLVALSPKIRKATLVAACMAVCRIKGFQPKRLIAGARRCREKLVPYSTREAYLDMLEEVYNFGRSSLVGLKAAANMAMKERRPDGFKSKA